MEEETKYEGPVTARLRGGASPLPPPPRVPGAERLRRALWPPRDAPHSAARRPQRKEGTRTRAAPFVSPGERVLCGATVGHSAGHRLGGPNALVSVQPAHLVLPPGGASSVVFHSPSL